MAVAESKTTVALHRKRATIIYLFIVSAVSDVINDV